MLKYLNLRIFWSPLGFNVNQTDRIMELVNECFLTEKLRKVDTYFRVDSMASLILTRNVLHKSEMEYHGIFGHTLRRIQHIALLSRIDINYTACHIETQTVAPTLPGFQGIKCGIQYLDSHQHKTKLILLIIMMDQISSDLHGVGIKLNTTPPRIVKTSIKMHIMLELST